jgi:hypothetical protein
MHVGRLSRALDGSNKQVNALQEQVSAATATPCCTYMIHTLMVSVQAHATETVLGGYIDLLCYIHDEINSSTVECTTVTNVFRCNQTVDLVFNQVGKLEHKFSLGLTAGSAAHFEELSWYV